MSRRRYRDFGVVRRRLRDPGVEAEDHFDHREIRAHSCRSCLRLGILNHDFAVALEAVDEHSDIQDRIALRVDEHLDTFEFDVLTPDRFRELWQSELHDAQRTTLRDDEPCDRWRIGIDGRKRGTAVPAAGQNRHECHEGAGN